jgi:hypothetical protein
MFGATTLSTALVIDICKGVTRPPQRTKMPKRPRSSSRWYTGAKHVGAGRRKRPKIRGQNDSKSRQTRRPTHPGAVCFGAPPLHVCHICYTSRESKLKRKKSNENSSFRHAFELTEASTRNTSKVYYCKGSGGQNRECSLPREPALGRPKDVDEAKCRR